MRLSSAFAETIVNLARQTGVDVRIAPVEEELDTETIAYEVSQGRRPLTVVDENLLTSIESSFEASLALRAGGVQRRLGACRRRAAARGGERLGPEQMVRAYRKSDAAPARTSILPPRASRLCPRVRARELRLADSKHLRPLRHSRAVIREDRSGSDDVRPCAASSPPIGQKESRRPKLTLNPPVSNSSGSLSGCASRLTDARLKRPCTDAPTTGVNR